MGSDLGYTVAKAFEGFGGGGMGMDGWSVQQIECLDKDRLATRYWRSKEARAVASQSSLTPAVTSAPDSGGRPGKKTQPTLLPMSSIRPSLSVPGLELKKQLDTKRAALVVPPGTDATSSPVVTPPGAVATSSPLVVTPGAVASSPAHQQPATGTPPCGRGERWQGGRASIRALLDKWSVKVLEIMLEKLETDHASQEVGSMHHVVKEALSRKSNAA